DVVRPGTKLQQIVQHRKDTGTFIGDVDEHCKKVRESSLSGSSVLHEISDGRWIPIQNKAVQGGGWVCTIED
ncbi:PAS-domain containing protein, partial [Acinetobacter baumannii]|uniref:PAS-domain containing protein n=1 Tax=Acinetobacter baumannii TaxID=470 RepID=UPI001112BD57